MVDVRRTGSGPDSLWSTHELPWWPGYLYAAYFASYLSGLAAGGPLSGVLLGSATAAAVMATRRNGHPKALQVMLTAVIVAGAVAITAMRDTHDAGLLTGLILGVLLRQHRATAGATTVERLASHGTGPAKTRTDRTDANPRAPSAASASA